MSDRLEQLQKLHQADPNDPFLTYGIALELSKAGQEEDALAWLDKTLERDAGYHYAYFQKGRVLSSLGRVEEARAVIRAGIDKASAAGDMHAASELSGLLQSLED